MRFKPSSCYTKKQDGCSSSGVAFLRASVPMRFVTSTCNPGRKGPSNRRRVGAEIACAQIQRYPNSLRF